MPTSDEQRAEALFTGLLLRSWRRMIGWAIRTKMRCQVPDYYLNFRVGPLGSTGNHIVDHGAPALLRIPGVRDFLEPVARKAHALGNDFAFTVGQRRLSAKDHAQRQNQTYDLTRASNSVHILHGLRLLVTSPTLYDQNSSLSAS
jgi:hypothetical protein